MIDYLVLNGVSFNVISKPTIKTFYLIPGGGDASVAAYDPTTKKWSNVEGVVGPQTGAKRMSELMAPQIGYGTWHASPAKKGTGEQKEMVFTDEEIVRIQGKTLVCEDVVTTAGSVELTARAITRAGGEVLPWILCLVNRSGQSDINGRKIVALITRYANIWDPTTCPACAEGSIVVRQPKDNWPQLNAVKGAM